MNSNFEPLGEYIIQEKIVSSVSSRQCNLSGIIFNYFIQILANSCLRGLDQLCQMSLLLCCVRGCLDFHLHHKYCVSWYLDSVCRHSFQLRKSEYRHLSCSWSALDEIEDRWVLGFAPLTSDKEKSFTYCSFQAAPLWKAFAVYCFFLTFTTSTIVFQNRIPKTIHILNKSLRV